jgi:transaldolase
MSANLKDLTTSGVSVWLDDLSRDRITSGNLQQLIDNYSVRGITTNPTIFAGALAAGTSYGSILAELAQKQQPIEETVFEIMARDVADACDIMMPLYESSRGVDGRVSIEVDPRLANDTEGTIAQALKLHALVSKPNVMIKIPATKAGLAAITAVTAAGISVNVTLIFSVSRYDQVIDAYFEGLRQASENGHNLATIHSVASFFVSRVDTEVDSRLEGLGDAAALQYRSRSAVANARLAYRLFERRFAGEDWKALAAQGASLQRPLMASTGVKDPNLPDTMYVTELVAPHLVNTMPEKTMMAVADHGVIASNSITANYSAAAAILDGLAAIGIDFESVAEKLEAEGVTKFIDSWNQLVETVSEALKKSA